MCFSTILQVKNNASFRNPQYRSCNAKDMAIVNRLHRGHGTGHLTSTIVTSSTAPHNFFLLAAAWVDPGGAPFSQLSSGVKDAMVVFTRLVKCHFMTKTCKKAG